MLDIGFFLDLAIILISTKVLGLITRNFDMPQVVGALVAGLIMGPSLLNIVHESDFIHQMAELGVVALMFTAGLETDTDEMKKSGKASLVIALFGVLVPLLGGFGIAVLFADTPIGQMSKLELLQNIFIGVILTATSVSITVETLREMGKLKSATGTAILGAAVIDDVIGIIVYTVVSSMADDSVGLWSVLGRIVLFFIFSAVVAIASFYLFRYLSHKHGPKRRIPLYGLVFALLMSFAAEHFFGVADITGAYIAGLIISNVKQADYISSKFDVLSFMLLSPIFFASIGIKTHITGVTSQIVIFTLLLLVLAVLSKVVGCGLGARMMGFNNTDSLRIGVGMVSRGEVALILAGKGAAIGLMNTIYFAPLILVVVVTTIATPILLKVVYKDKRQKALA